MASNQIKLNLNVTANTSQAKTEFANLKNSLNSVIAEGSRVDIGSSMQAGMKKAVQAAKELQVHLAQATNPKTGQLQLDKLNMSLQASGKSIASYSKELLQGGEVGQQAFTSMAKTITATQAPVARLNGAVKSLVQSFGTALKYQISYGAINAVTNSIREAVTYAKDLNKTLTDIRIVTGMTADESDRLASSANKMAKNLKSTTQEVLKGQLIYLQQGDSLALAAQKSEITTKAANISFGTNQQQMSEYLTAIWNSYQVGSNELELFVDKLAAVGATTATSMEELSTAMTKVAATANAVGVTYDQLNATIATISSATRTSAETVGTALKTIYARIGDLKIGGKDEDGLGLGTVSKQLKQAGIDILDTNGNLRDMGLVVEEVGNKWQHWTNAQQVAIAQAIAGKRQYTQLMALFENWDAYNETLSTSQNAEGELQRQQDIWAESWEAASNKVKNVTEGMYQNLLNDDIMIDFTNALALFIEGIDAITDGLGGIPGILAIILQRFLAIKGVAIEETFANIGRNIALTFKKGAAFSQFEQIKNSFTELRASISKIPAEAGMKNFINQLADVNSLQVVLEKNANKLTSAQKMAFEGQIESINREYESLNETAGAVDKLRGEIMELGQANGFKLTQQQIQMMAQVQNNPYSIKSIVGEKHFAKGTSFTALAKDGQVLDNVLTKLKGRFGENSDYVKQFASVMKKGTMDSTILHDAVNRLTSSSSGMALVLEEVFGKTEKGKMILELIKPILDEIGLKEELIEEKTREIGIESEKTGKLIKETADDAKLGWSGVLSTLMSTASAMMSASSAVDSISGLFDGEKKSASDYSRVVTSALMSVVMAAMMVTQAFNSANAAMGWVALALTGITLVVEIAGKVIDANTRTVEEINEEIQETENNIQSLRDEITKLQKEQATASGIRAIELDGEIERLREIVKLETERQKLLQGEKEEKTREDIRKEAQKYEITNNTEPTEYYSDPIENSSMYSGAGYTPSSAPVVNTVTELVSVFRGKAYNYKDDPSYTNLISYQQAMNEALQDLSNTFGKYSTEMSEDGELARTAIIQNLDKMKEVLPEEEQEEFLFSKLFTISPDSFSSLDKFKSQYGDLLNKIGYSEEDIDKYWDNFNLDETAAAVNARKFNNTITSMKSTVNTAGEALKELSENGGRLGVETISKLEESWEILGDGAQHYSDQLWIAQGNQKEMNQVIQDATEATIQAQIANGSFIGQSKEQIAIELKAIGVKNASAVATKIYNEQIKASEFIEKNGTEITYKYAEALYSYAGANGTAASSVEELIIQQTLLNNKELNLSQQIEELKKLADAAGQAGLSTSFAQRAMANIGNIKAVGGRDEFGRIKPGFPTQYEYNDKIYNTLEEAQSAALKDASSFDAILEIKMPDLGDFSGGGGDGGDKPDPKKELEDWLSFMKYKWEQELITTQEYIDAINKVINSGLLTEQELLEKEREIWAAWDTDVKRRETLRNTNISARQDRGIFNWDEDYGDAIANLEDVKAKFNKHLQETNYDVTSDKFQALRQELLNAEKYVESTTDTYINRAKTLADASVAWGKMFGFETGQNELKIYKQMYADQLKYLNDIKATMSEDEYNERRKKIETEFYEWQKKEIKDAADYELELWKERRERRKAMLEAEKTIQEGLNSTSNSIREAQHDINKEIQKSLTLSQYLDAETRKLIFNTEDYLELNKELNDLQTKANKLAREYNKKILGKTKEEIEKLTAEYERQNEMLMKQYEIKKAELEIEKKRLELNNILNERNTRMFVNGEWQWVADAQAIATAQQELLDAQYARDTASIEEEQQMALNELSSTIEGIDLQISKAEKRFKEFCDKLDGNNKRLDSVLLAFGNVISTAGTAIQKKLEDITGTKFGNFFTLPAGNNNTSNNKHPDAKGILWSDENATGTDNAHGGISIVNEKGLELWATKYGQMVELNPGDKIFNHEQFDFLYRFSKNPMELFRGVSNNNVVDNSIKIGNFEIKGDSQEGEALRSILMRLTSNH